MNDTSEKWTGRLGFVLATIGSAIGLGSIWKFPYEVGENGGSAFVIFYLLGLAVVVAPLMLAEFALGRAARRDARMSIERVAELHGKSRLWGTIGLLGITASSLILSFYSVIGGWALAYAVETAHAGLPGSEATAVQSHFDRLLASPLQVGLYHTIFMMLVAGIVARGVAGGIEAAAKILMPVMVALLIGLALYGMAVGDLDATVRYLFHFDPARITARAAMEAVGLGFFSIGVGLAVMITYAAYAGEEINLASAAFIAIVSDTTVSFLAGFAIFPIVFAIGLDPASGPGLMFVTLPLAFAEMPMGEAIAFAFFALLVVAALVSAVSMLEMPVAYLRNRFGLPRTPSALVSAAAIWTIGLLSVLSFNLWRDWFPLSAVPMFASSTFFDLLDHLTSNVMLPIGGLAIALFVGWVLPRRFLGASLSIGDESAAVLHIALRYLVPAAVAAAALIPLLAR